MAPTPKKASTPFMVEVCCVVEVEMSPIKASAAVLKIPIATPAIIIKPR